MQKIRNIAIIAHVDHGKTTIVDKMLLQSDLFRENQEVGDLIMDSNDLEKERGITITSKTVSIDYKGTKINIIDTPGHSDFGGEVERVLNMADGVLLIVDAFEGPMPQTRFVLQKAIEIGLKPVVVVNKVDKQNCAPDDAQEAVFDLMFNLGATEHQLDFQTIFGSAKNGWMSTDWQKPTTDIVALLDAVIEHVPPAPLNEGTLQLQITSLDYSSFVGRIAIGKVHRGVIKSGAAISIVKRDGTIVKSKIKELYTHEGFDRKKVDEVISGDICAVSGIEGFEIGDTLCDLENPEGLTPMDIDEPTMSMLFTINNSPFFGKEGKFVTSRHLQERLEKELEKNLALRVKETESADSYLVFGRGILHLSVLIETMRREGYELQVGQPQVLVKEIDGKKCEPVETMTVDSPEGVSGKVIELVTMRKGELVSMEPKGDVTRMEFSIPSRGLMGLRNNILTATAGQAVMSYILKGYEPWKGDIPMRSAGVMIAAETGTTFAYSIDKLQDRGKFFVDPGESVYEGQIVGEHSRDKDLDVNICKAKKQSNVRSSGADDKVRMVPPIKFSLEEAMEYIQGDEYVELTPSSMRLRKIHLTENARKLNGRG